MERSNESAYNAPARATMSRMIAYAMVAACLAATLDASATLDPDAGEAESRPLAPGPEPPKPPKPGSPKDDPGSCDCRTASAPDAGFSAGLGLLLAAAAAARLRRRAHDTG
jgi:MYXO-CTERM domain-containing protein